MHSSRYGLAALALAALALPVRAQLQFDELGGGLVPSHTDLTRAVVLGDVDGDGDADLFFGNSDLVLCCFKNDVLRPNQLYLNDGTGTFTDVTASRLPTRAGYTWDAALVDVDADGDPDLVLGGTGRSQLFLNDGTGTFRDFTHARMPLDSGSTTALAVGDVDGDGDPDLFLGNYHQKNRLFLNDGSGTFRDVSSVALPDDKDATYSAALGDVDGDGDVDLVVGNSGRNRLYLNDGTGIFTHAPPLSFVSSVSISLGVALGDVDADGDLDLVVGNWGKRNQLYLNDGRGVFTDETTTRMPPETKKTRAVALGDLDGDGDLDLVFAGADGNLLYLNDGTGTFADASPRMPLPAQDSRAVALGDTDGDGDLDMVLGNGLLGVGGSNRIYSNLLWQLDTPSSPVRGQTFQLDVYARYGAAGASDLAHPLLAAAPANVPLPPFGTLFLSPLAIVALPPVPIPPFFGMASVSVQVPAVPALAGVPLYAQALVVQTAFAHLTNATADVIQ